MGSGKKDTTSCLALADNVGGGWSTEDTVLADEKLLDTVCGTNLSNQLNDLWVPVTTITTNNQEAVLDTFWNGKEDRGNEGLRVVRLLENHDLLTKTGATGESVTEARIARFITMLRRCSGVVLTFLASGPGME